MSRKQVGVIYRSFKEGYEVIGYLKEAVDAILTGDYETADSKVRGFKTVEVF